MIPAGKSSRVLIVKFGAIGDVVMALPAVYALFQRGLAVDWVCGPLVAPLLACYPWIRTIVADDRMLLKGSGWARVREVLRLWRRVTGIRYELCATLYYDARYAALTAPVRAARKLRLSREDRGHRLLPGRSHAAELERILLGEEDSCRERSRKPVRPERLPESPLPKRSGVVRIALVPGGASNMLRQQTLRRWAVESYAALAGKLLDRGYEVVLMGGADDRWVLPEFEGLRAGASGGRLIDAVGSLELPELVAAFNACDGVVSHDTGPLHLAGLSSAVVLGLFGPTDPGCFLPRRGGVRGLWGGEGFACRPCYDGKDFAPCRDNGCMRQITVGMVLGELDVLLAERTASDPAEWTIVLPSTSREVWS